MRVLQRDRVHEAATARPSDDSVPARLQAFDGIGLSALQARASLMDRRDNKYVLSTHQLKALLRATQADFDILEIDGVRQFQYANLYFDSAAVHTHQDHNKGRRKRIKLRYRHYVDSDLHFVEIKIKGFRKKTLKMRRRIQSEALLQDGELHPSLQAFCQQALQSAGYRRWPHRFLPSIWVFYDRITLVAKTGDERITLDNRIAFSRARVPASDPRAKRQPLNDDRWVVEVKSRSGRTATDVWLLRQRRRPVSLCSKYGMGINLLKLPHTNNRFSRVLRRHFEVASGSPT